MAKTKTPFFSIGSRGTVGGVLTSQKRGSATLLRETPIPTDPYSLAQAYQRWLYRDYAYLWTLQTNATKQTYRSRASRYHITGFSLWMREYLRDLPDIVGFWKLDEKAGATAYDSGRNALHATIFGATPATGRIDGALSFDGLNDYINCTANPLLDLPTAFSLEFFFYAALPAAGYPGFYGIAYKEGCYGIAMLAGQIVALVYIAGGGLPRAASGVFVTANTFYHIVINYNNINLTIIVNDGAPVSVARAGPLDIDHTKPLLLGSQNLIANRYITGREDHVILRDRILDTTEISRHSLRRYPA